MSALLAIPKKGVFFGGLRRAPASRRACAGQTSIGRYWHKIFGEICVAVLEFS